MKKFKKLIVALILGLFCGISLIFGNSIVKANPLEDYEVIERINYSDDNWEFTWLPSVDDNWNEYGLRFNLELSNSMFSGITYFSSISEIIEDSGIYLLTCDYSYSLVSNIISINIALQVGDSINSLGIVRLYTIADNITYLYTPDTITTGWVELIHINSNDLGYEAGYQAGYEDAIEEVVLKGSPLLNCQISVYDSDNMILGSEPINNNLITADSHLPSGVLYSYATDYLNSGESGRIEIAFSIAITPNDRLQEFINFTNGSYISEMFSSYNWVSSNRFIVEQNLVNASKIVKDINLIPNLAMVSFTFDDVDNLEFFEYGITSSYYDSIYNNGYDVGYDVGYDIGFNESSEENFDLGYQAGYNAGLESEFSFGSELLKVASIPFNVLGQILSFEIFDVNIWLLLCGILTVCIVIWVIKKFRG